MNRNTIISNRAVEGRDLGLYIHIPFCARKCDYCDFLSAPASQNTMEQYFHAMLEEIGQYQGNTGDYIVPTIFFGGGTPSFVDASYIEEIMELFNQVFRIDHKRLEATMEMNPGTVMKEKLLTYKKAGINRISFGLQSADNKELSLLGRIHTYEQFEDNYKLARQLGFDNINIDLMSALPGQTLSSWENTLNKVIELNPEHISAYSLIIEEGTKFYDRYQENAVGAKELPDEETDRLIYHKTKEILLENGYHRYEISNYAKPGFECRHNSSYWIGTDYLGIGLGASSLLDGTRFSNISDIAQYMNKCNEYRSNPNRSGCDGMDKTSAMYNRINNSIWQQDITLEDVIGIRTGQEKLTKQDRMEEFMFLGLRMCDGISRKNFYQRFGTQIDSIYGEEIKRLEKDNLIWQQGDMIRLTDYGIDISNYVFSMFLRSDQ